MLVVVLSSFFSSICFICRNVGLSCAHIYEILCVLTAKDCGVAYDLAKCRRESRINGGFTHLKSHLSLKGDINVLA